ncbi:hypothetical protein [Kamptonema formosum]|uniref:hypothetical protein n=1 Tax=Kamptonema formosum TaxID=331992 RepID=UPI00034C15D6|nr:hypothetical protein [Oscillatoria sp. PCC 10802]
MVRLILIAILAGLLAACSAVGPGPSMQVVQQAIAMQLSQTQGQLAQQLGRNQPPELQINRVAIAKMEPLQIQQLPAFRVRGTYEMTVKLPAQKVTQRETPFEVYLQRQKQAQTWRMARRVAGSDSEPVWATYLIKPTGYQ